MKIDGHTRLATVVANPIKHPFHPSFTTELLKQPIPMGLSAWEVEELDYRNSCQYSSLPDVWINLSMPYKEQSHSLSDQLSE